MAEETPEQIESRNLRDFHRRLSGWLDELSQWYKDLSAGRVSRIKNPKGIATMVIRCLVEDWVR